MDHKKKGYLLVNLGTPEHATHKSVRVFLRPFLMDPQVIGLPFFLRWILVNFIIIPLRLNKVVKAYRGIWTKEGSPLRVNTQKIVDSVGHGDTTNQLDFDLEHKTNLDSQRNENCNKNSKTSLSVEASMRYGEPSIEKAIHRLRDKGCSDIYVLPLFPQYSAATTEAVRGEVNKHIGTDYFLMESFYDNPLYIESMKQVILETIKMDAIDHLLFSFHGIPIDHIKNAVPACSGLKECANCTNKTPENYRCYRGQCVRTAHKLVVSLGLAQTKWSISFQSRLGRGEWLGPYTDEVLLSLGRQGKRLAIVSPSFVNDGLETLEELNMRGRESFMTAGGKEFIFIPSLNAHPTWVNSLDTLLRSETGWQQEAIS